MEFNTVTISDASPWHARNEGVARVPRSHRRLQSSLWRAEIFSMVSWASADATRTCRHHHGAVSAGYPGMMLYVARLLRAAEGPTATSSISRSRMLLKESARMQRVALTMRVLKR